MLGIGVWGCSRLGASPKPIGLIWPSSLDGRCWCLLGQRCSRAILWKSEARLDIGCCATDTRAYETGCSAVYSLLQWPVTHSQWQIVAGQIRAVSVEGVRYRLTRTLRTGITLGVKYIPTRLSENEKLPYVTHQPHI